MAGYESGALEARKRAAAAEARERAAADPSKRAMGGDTRYDEWFNQAHGGQLSSAEALFGAAGRGGTLRGAQARGAGLQQSLGGMGEGGLAGRAAIMDTGQASWGAGQMAAEMGSEERLQASDAYMQAQAQRAAWEQARAGTWKQRFDAEQQAMMEGDAAYQERKRREAEATRKLVGSVLGAGGAGIAGGAGGGGSGGGGSGYSSTHPDDEHGGGYGKAKYV